MRNAAKVLIVDDDKSSSQLLSEVVKRIGFKPVVVHKPTEALNMVKLQTVHAALVDVLLPKISGVDLVQEFRKTKFGDNPVILVSGVFKDKNFASEAMKKTGAVEFLFKPFGVEDLTAAIDRAFGSLLATESWTAQALLSRRLNTQRERAKAIEHLVPIQGSDFPFILSLVTEVEISGNLNLVNEAAEIFGVTLVKGYISEVDSSDSQANGILSLISNGYLAEEDWEQFQRTAGKRITLERLVAEGMVSPHAIDVTKHEQILLDLKSICSSQTLQINFVPQDDAGEPSRHAVRISELNALISNSIDEFCSDEYLEQFYSQVFMSHIEVIATPEHFERFFAEHTGDLWPVLQTQIKAGLPLEELLSKCPDRKQALRAVHAMVLDRMIAFEDANKTRNLETLLGRFQKVHAELKGRSADQIFNYFGAQGRMSQSTIQNIFDSYVRSNDPSTLPAEASPELRKLAEECFNLMKAAYDVMIDEKKRAAFFEKQKAQEQERVRKSKELVNKGLEQIRKGQFPAAVTTLREAGHLHASTMQYLMQVWAEIKAGVNITKPQLIETQKKMEALAQEERRSVYYYMAAGLVKKQLGDPSAQVFFERAFQADSSFIEARRELNALNNARESKDKRIDLLTGDITEIVSQLFRRKAD
jgi:FixJ family two-component response regulator